MILEKHNTLKYYYCYSFISLYIFWLSYYISFNNNNFEFNGGLGREQVEAQELSNVAVWIMMKIPQVVASLWAVSFEQNQKISKIIDSDCEKAWELGRQKEKKKREEAKEEG